ncbi:MAG TPA: aldolase [Candidatus Limnocylindria bacterium]|nr:aldolase [Candidatus Limnocylindria bacterium]
MKRRMHNIFRADGRAFVLAIDHAAMMPSPDLDDAGRVISESAAGGVDAYLASYGTLKRCQREFGNAGVILRADGGISSLRKPMGDMDCLYTAMDAVRLGADGMLVMAYPGSQQNEHSLKYLARLAAECDALSLPLCAEALPYGFERPEGVDTRSVENVAFACRQAAELGADFVKSEFVGGERFQDVTRACPAPVLVLGGGKAVSEEEMLLSIRGALDAGAKGIIMGRNICRHRNIRAVCGAIAMVIHEDAPVGDALRRLREA